MWQEDEVCREMKPFAIGKNRNQPQSYEMIAALVRLQFNGKFMQQAVELGQQGSGGIAVSQGVVGVGDGAALFEILDLGVVAGAGFSFIQGSYRPLGQSLVAQFTRRHNSHY